MTKKDYIIIANQFKNALGIAQDVRHYKMNLTIEEVLKATIKDFCLMLAKDNPKFDAQKFAMACGLPQVKEGGNNEVVSEVAAELED